MISSSADLFGTFLETVTTAQTGSANVPNTSVGPTSGVHVLPIPFPSILQAQSPVSTADAVIKSLNINAPRMMDMKELLPLAGNSYTLLVDALGQLQSYGLITNNNGQIALSSQGAEVACISR